MKQDKRRNFGEAIVGLVADLNAEAIVKETSPVGIPMGPCYGLVNLGKYKGYMLVYEGYTQLVLAIVDKQYSVFGGNSRAIWNPKMGRRDDPVMQEIVSEAWKRAVQLEKDKPGTCPGAT